MGPSFFFFASQKRLIWRENLHIILEANFSDMFSSLLFILVPSMMHDEWILIQFNIMGTCVTLDGITFWRVLLHFDMFVLCLILIWHGYSTDFGVSMLPRNPWLVKLKHLMSRNNTSGNVISCSCYYPYVSYSGLINLYAHNRFIVTAVSLT